MVRDVVSRPVSLVVNLSLLIHSGLIFATGESEVHLMTSVGLEFGLSVTAFSFSGVELIGLEADLHSSWVKLYHMKK